MAERGSLNVPVEVRKLVYRCIPSVAELEALVTVQREPRRSWTGADVARALGFETNEAGRILFDLMAGGLLRLTAMTPPTYQYDPNDGALRQTADTLCALYASHRGAVMALVTSRPTASVLLFADAFRIRPATPPRPDERGDAREE